MAAELMANIESLGVSTQQPLHDKDKVWLGRFNDQMEMVTHQTIRMNLPYGLATGLR